jgi:hypothetical protein
MKKEEASFAMWPLRSTYRGAVVHITHKGRRLVKWGASVIYRHRPDALTGQIEKQTTGICYRSLRQAEIRRRRLSAWR